MEIEIEMETQMKIERQRQREIEIEIETEVIDRAGEDGARERARARDLLSFCFLFHCAVHPAKQADAH